MALARSRRLGVVMASGQVVGSGAEAARRRRAPRREGRLLSHPGRRAVAPRTRAGHGRSGSAMAWRRGEFPPRRAERSAASALAARHHRRQHRGRRSRSAWCGTCRGSGRRRGSGRCPPAARPTMRADQRHHRQRAGRHAGGADAAEDADEHHRHLLRQASGRRRRTARGTARSRPRTARCRSGWRWRRRSARSARCARGRSEFFVGHAQRGRQRGVARGGGERHQHRFLHAAEERDRRIAADELQRQRIDHEHVQRQRQHHHADVRAQLAPAGPSRTARPG